MGTEVKTIKFRGDYIGRDFVSKENPDESWEIKSPADLKDLGAQVDCHYENVDRAVELGNADAIAKRADRLAG